MLLRCTTGAGSTTIWALPSMASIAGMDENGTGENAGPWRKSMVGVGVVLRSAEFPRLPARLPPPWRVALEGGVAGPPEAPFVVCEAATGRPPPVLFERPMSMVRSWPWPPLPLKGFTDEVSIWPTRFNLRGEEDTTEEREQKINTHLFDYIPKVNANHTRLAVLVHETA